ncbi:uncharacterized protein LOC117112978 [Anneissia japonica]|uniref:uncharacterized protein LOC117112978 n=1 Tax=Anneissia japonica TaxID=1529436 RepID=UPI001425965F|nr:uncharacterized protein LOC117112978 [Anneissia japonica]
MSCPSCSVESHYESVTAVPDLFVQCYMSVIVKCNTCQCQLQCQQCNTHVCVLQQEHTYAKQHTNDSFQAILQQPLDASITSEMENLGHHLMQQKSRKSKDGVVTFISGGKVKKFRSMISGSEEATNEQYHLEISGLQCELKDILRTPFRMPHGDIIYIWV